MSTTFYDAFSDLQTNAQGRAALGILTKALNSGYQLLPQIDSGSGLRQTNQNFLDDVNNYATSIYNDIPNDNEDLSIWNAGRLGIVAGQTDEVLDGLADSAKVSRFDFSAELKKAVSDVTQTVTDAATGVGKTVGAVAAAPVQGLTAALTAFLYQIRTGLFIAGGVGLVYIFRKPLLGAAKKVSG